MQLHFLFSTILLATLTSLLGCGKKTEESQNLLMQQDPQLASSLEASLAKQELLCGSDRGCPSFVTKLAIVSNGKLKFCTGFLLDNQTVATASSCLPSNLRSGDLSCRHEIFFFFARSNQQPVRIDCDKVLNVAPIQGSDPYLWRSDVAYLRMARSENRRTVSPLRSGMNDGEEFYAWTVDKINENESIIRKTENCQAIHGSYFNPLANHHFSPVMLMAGCDFRPGNTGAPLLDFRGRVRGVISGPVETEEEAPILNKSLRKNKPLLHVANYACAPIPDDEEVADDVECGKPLDHNAYDSARREMISEGNLFRSALQKIEAALNEKNRYLKFSTMLVPEKDGFRVKIYPQCFKNVAKWIGEFNSSRTFTFNLELPEMLLKRSMSDLGRITAVESSLGKTPTYLQFRPSVLRSSQQATVYMWADGPVETFPSLSEKCGSLF